MKKVILSFASFAFVAFLAVPLLGGFSLAPAERLEVASYHPFDLYVLPPSVPDETAVIARTGADLKSATAQGLGTAVSYRKSAVLKPNRAPAVALVSVIAC